MTMTEREIAQAGDAAPPWAHITGWQVIATLTPLWVSGVAVLCIIAGYALAPALQPLLPRSAVWTPYLVLGSLFPAILAIAVLAQRAGRTLPLGVMAALIAMPIASAALIAGPLNLLLALGLAVVQTAICLALLGCKARVPTERLFPLFVFGFLTWAVVLELFTWEPMLTVNPPSWPLLVVGSVALAACCWWAFGASLAATGTRLVVLRALDTAAIVLLVLLAFRTDGLFTTDRLGDDGTFHHWGAYIGAAEAVRQGKFLLWDVPSIYGFLSTLSLSALPTPTTWQSLYLLNATASTLLAIWMYYTIRSLKPQPGGCVLAAVATAVVVFLSSTYPPTVSPEHYFPQSGAFRYGWCFALVGMLLLERRTTPGSRMQRFILAVGVVLWTVSMLWGADSAIYGSVIWLPAFAVIVLRDYAYSTEQRSLPILALWLLLPPVLMLSAVGVISIIYARLLGHNPDWRAYIEAILAFSDTDISTITGLYDASSVSSTLVVGIGAFLILATVATFVAKWSLWARELPVALALALGFWALLSYPIGEVFLFAIYRILPFLVLALSILLSIVAPHFEVRKNQGWIDAVRVGAIALLVSLIAGTLANFAELRFYTEAIRVEPFRGGNVTSGLPNVDPSLASLMQQAGVSASDPLFYAGSPYGNMMPAWIPADTGAPVPVSQQWLTGQPSTMAFLTDDRKREFMARGTARHHEPGWLIERTSQDDMIFTTGPWFFEQVNTAYVPTRVAENREWRLVYYEPSSQTHSVDHFIGEDLRARGPSFDLFVNGQPLNGIVTPSIWGSFGPEWTVPIADGTERCATHRGSLSVFTPMALEAEVTIGFPEGYDAPQLVVSVDDVAPITTELSRNGKARAPLSFQAGWNKVEIVAAKSGALETGDADPVTGCRITNTEEQIKVNYVEIRTRN